MGLFDSLKPFDCAYCNQKTPAADKINVSKGKEVFYSICKKCNARYQEITGGAYSYPTSLQQFKDVMDGKDTSFTDRKYFRKCNGCGKVYSYTDRDIKKNVEIANQAKKEANLGVLSALGGTSLETTMNRHRTEDLLNQIKDYSKCIYCQSSNVEIITEEQFKAEEAKNAAPAAGGTISAADELKKFKELLDMGVITQEEFDAKKKQLLGL